MTIVKLALGRIRFDTPEADAAARTLVGHLVAGTLPPEASTELIEALRGLRPIPTPRSTRRRT